MCTYICDDTKLSSIFEKLEDLIEDGKIQLPRDYVIRFILDEISINYLTEFYKRFVFTEEVYNNMIKVDQVLLRKSLVYGLYSKEKIDDFLSYVGIKIIS